MTKVKVPKRVAGVKVPKKVRKQAKKALKAAENPMVREFAAAAIGAATKAQAQARARSARPGSGASGEAAPARAVARIDGDRLVEAVRVAAADGLRRFLEGFEEGLRTASAAAREGGDNVEPIGQAEQVEQDKESGSGRGKRRKSTSAG